ncbi:MULTISPECIES: DUF6428 family protein [Rhizobium]|uniref:Uncharacterized protein n=1 Tax=Rhizobium tropici TaxID=398 RepID=A0ABR6R3Z4_RHITR|nr:MULTISPECIES: DUF6428 family protein [Rhizobium]AGB73134.1 hypothetical protein RTCIAT899_PA00160 [Rhizobium tropici CIAT 899]MBB4243639.1 hypothetical protein [Rhizobium tropici]MBB5595912.1 hypothetical protein [Rhizobium tropici]MBB6493905.1 hypothetical protein [Rhizobium tropici]
MKPGYHVTEVKAGQFSAFGCGANPEAWSEIFIQLWDIKKGDCTHMPAGKFYAIIRKVTENVKLDDTAKLTFEVSDGVQPMQFYCAAMPTFRAGAVHFELSPRGQATSHAIAGLPSSRGAAQSCCGPSTGKSASCG